MIGKPFDRIEKSDIDSLVANEVKERRTLEYKQELRHIDKKEFLADVSSFANASGGDLLYGVIEKRDANGPTGIPESAPGLAGINTDAEIRRLENMIRDSIKPRISGIHVRPIDGFLNGPVILVRIPKSYASPHMVQDTSRFYSRNSAGKYPLDVGEIRAAFALSESLPEKIRNFRNERIARIVADETPFQLNSLESHVRFIFHVIPAVAFDPTFRVDLGKIARNQEKM